MAPATIAGAAACTRSGRGAGWTREAIIIAIQEWVATYGEPPRAADWNPSAAKWAGQLWRVERYRAGRADGSPWPALNSAKRLFGGSLNAAIRAAGFAPARPGPRRRRDLAPAQAHRRDMSPEARLAEARAEAGDARMDAAEARAAAKRLAARLERAEATIAVLREERRRLAGAAGAHTTSAAPRRLTAAERAELLRDGPAGPSALASALRDLAAARTTNNPARLRDALRRVAQAAVSWQQRL